MIFFFCFKNKNSRGSSDFNGGCYLEKQQYSGYLYLNAEVQYPQISSCSAVLAKDKVFTDNYFSTILNACPS